MQRYWTCSVMEIPLYSLTIFTFSSLIWTESKFYGWPIRESSRFAIYDLLFKCVLRTAMYMLKIQIKILKLKLISDLGKKNPLFCKLQTLVLSCCNYGPLVLSCCNYGPYSFLAVITDPILYYAVRIAVSNCLLDRGLLWPTPEEKRVEMGSSQAWF